ncbi:MAG: NADAR family protein [Myxococcaceae bacterium]
MPPLTRADLVAAMARGERFSYLPFYGHTPRADGALSNACFSQWWRCSFELDGVRYSSAEQFMMASKARLFGDREALARILAESDPAKVKQLGREVRGYDDAKWGAARFDAVTRGSVAKFASSAALRAFLLATGDAVLVEAAPRDRIWGIGLGRENPNVSKPEAWRGQNLLGFALVAAREQLRLIPG